MQELQRRQAASDVAAQSDRRDVATLHGALLHERTAFQAEIARRDARIDQLAQESRHQEHQERLLADHLMKLESHTAAQHHEAEHAKVQLEGALERLAQRAVMDQRTAESVRMADAQQKQDITSEVANLQASLAGETVRLQGSLQVAQRSVMELSQKLESERQARHEDSQAFHSKLTHAHTEAESMIRCVAVNVLSFGSSVQRRAAGCTCAVLLCGYQLRDLRGFGRLLVLLGVHCSWLALTAAHVAM